MPWFLTRLTTFSLLVKKRVEPCYPPLESAWSTRAARVGPLIVTKPLNTTSGKLLDSVAEVDALISKNEANQITYLPGLD